MQTGISLSYELFWALAGSLLAGALIGFEREWRGRPAGLRTHILVCFTATILMLAAARQSDWALALVPQESIVTDPTRMAHGILTGIGFLCAGVIFREGFSIHGLTTAASLWVTSAIGILFGVGLVGLGVVATVLTFGVLAGLRAMERLLPGPGGADLRIRYLRERAMKDETLLALLREAGLPPCRLGYRLLDGGRVVEHTTTVRSAKPVRVDALAERLLAMPEVLEFELSPHAE